MEKRNVKYLAVILATLVFLTSTTISGQSTAPFAPATNNDNRDPFGNASKVQTRNSTAKKQDASAKVKMPEVADTSFQYLAVGADFASRTRIERALSSEAEFDYLDQPLRDVIDDISYSHNIPNSHHYRCTISRRTWNKY